MTLFILPAAVAADFTSKLVASSDGVRLAVREWGNAAGPEILLIHGGNQSQLAWRKQVESDLAKTFRIVTFDMRGHGESDKPTQAASYSNAKQWADDMRAVISATSLKRPILVAWSAGGCVALNYVATYGDRDLSGLVLVDASDPRYFADDARKLIPLMARGTLESTIEFTQAFLLACFAQAPVPADLNYMVAFNMVVPPISRAGMASWKLDVDEALKRVGIPTLVIHGKQDRIIRYQASEHYARTIPGASLSIYESAGHMPFWEEADRFNAELASFARQHSRP
ncbi:alpha/beta hydrolase [Ramlibacter sp. AW1]|uniref:Alpha/beta hydrolase n=1 Tax=Ramlibacter aurantiacus TaxID=2801330 RepID=A0A937D9Q1_9BURK|nr:alpha/beta hydrolase [Ramlibacter aurantiacus]MBL0423426.1 alpha/beta hydrolase [Ramlibacter aurantiacus]